MYTANLASMLTIDAQKIQRYNNLHEIIQAGEQVCVQEVRKRTCCFLWCFPYRHAYNLPRRDRPGRGHCTSRKD
jgi:hypothetical protein